MSESEETIAVEVYPRHPIPDRSVVIGIATETPHEMDYHFISPKRALSLLAQLEQKREILEAMVQERPI